MLKFILTANKKYRNYERYIEELVKTRYTIDSAIDWQSLAGEPLYAYILRGAWVVSCECGETLFYEPGKSFFCPTCLNAHIAHSARPVIMPENRKEIEELLLKRPNPQNRNWLVGESLENLIAENEVNL